jgi:hypothetical protein
MIQNTEKFLKPNIFKSQSGFTLLSGIVSLGLAGIFVTIMATSLKNMMDGRMHNQLKDELVSIRNTVGKRLSCENTFTEAVKKACNKNYTPGTGDKPKAQPRPFVRLLDFDDKQIGVKPNKRPKFSKIGKWTLRASCVNNDTDNFRSLLIFRARPIPGGKGFFKDPLNKRLQDWQPLYQKDTTDFTHLCSDQIGGNDPIEAEHLESNPMKSSGSCGDGILGMILGGKSTLYSNTVNCPSGKIAISGGAECMVGSGRGNILTLIGGDPRGFMVASRPANGGKSWFVQCCLKMGGILGIGGKKLNPQSYAVCVTPHK